MSQTNLPRRQILVFLAERIPKPPMIFGLAFFSQPTKWIPLLLESLQMKFRVV